MKRKNFVFIFLLLITLTLSAQDTNDSFYFVQITDTHLGTGNNSEFTQKLIDMINDLPMKIEIVLHTGDIVQYPLQQDSVLTNAIELFTQLEMPVLYVAGNHDIRKKSMQTSTSIFEENFGPLMVDEEVMGVKFIGIFSNPLAWDFPMQDYDPLPELETELIEAGDMPVILFHHIPSVEDFYLNQMHDGWKEPDRSEWISLLNKYNVKAVLAGHFHRDEHHWLGDVPLYVCASVTTKWGRQPTFRIYEFKDGKLSYRTVYLEPEEE